MGQYTFLNLPIAFDYIVAAFPDYLPPQYYQQKDHFEQASFVNIIDNHKYEINFIIDRGSFIFGKIIIENQNNTRNQRAVNLSQIKIDISSESAQFNTSVYADSIGQFEILGLQVLR